MYISNLKSGRYFQLWTIMLLIPLTMLIRVNRFVFQVNLTIDTSAVQPLDHDIIALFKVQYKKNFLEYCSPKLEESSA